MHTLSASIGRDHYKTLLTAGRHHILADEPLDEGGTDLGLAPYQFVLAGLAACKVMTVRFYADRENWPLERVDANLVMDVQREGSKTIVDINAQLQFTGNLSSEQKQKLLIIADKCPVHKLLLGQISITSVLNEN